MQNPNPNPQLEIKNAVIILLAVASVILNGVINHFFEPVGLLVTFCILPVPAALITFVTKGINSILKSILVFCCVSLNDIALKLYAAGTHDVEGQGIVNLIFFAGLVPVYGILIASIFIHKQNSLFSKIAAAIIFPVLIVIHCYFFTWLGLERDH